jgi:chitodextrinase
LKLKIISDGTRAGTKVVNEDGAEVEGVTRVQWNFSQEDGEVWATFTIGDAPCEAKAQAPEAEGDGAIL